MCATVARPGRSASRNPCRVTRITDGDSIECEGIGRIRLIGIDAPELSQKPYGKMSGSELAKRIPVGTTTQLEHDVQARDRNGRTLGYVWYRGELINWWMVRQGWALTLTYAPDVQYVSWFAQAVKAARGDQLGLWAIDGFACEPYDHRHGRC